MEAKQQEKLEDTLLALIRHVDLLSWHVRQLQASGTVDEEISGSLENVKDAFKAFAPDYTN